MAKKKDNIIYKGYCFRLKPNREQREYLNQTFGCVRKLYNYYVESIDLKKITISIDR